MSGHLIGPKSRDRSVKFLEPVLDSPRTVWATCVINYALNYILVCMRPKMTMHFGSTKWNRCLVSGLPTDSPLLVQGLLKTVPVLLVGPKLVRVCFKQNIA